MNQEGSLKYNNTIRFNFFMVSAYSHIPYYRDQSPGLQAGVFEIAINGVIAGTKVLEFMIPVIACPYSFAV